MRGNWHREVLTSSGPEEIGLGGGWCLFVSGLFFSLQEHRSGEAALLCLGCTLDGALVHLVLLGEDLETGQECPPWTGCAGAGEELLPAPPVGL